jgi:hypothetical protein
MDGLVVESASKIGYPVGRRHFRWLACFLK